MTPVFETIRDYNLYILCIRQSSALRSWTALSRLFSMAFTERKTTRGFTDSSRISIEVNLHCNGFSKLGMIWKTNSGILAIHDCPIGAIPFAFLFHDISPLPPEGLFQSVARVLWAGEMDLRHGFDHVGFKCFLKDYFSEARRQIKLSIPIMPVE